MSALAEFLVMIRLIRAWLWENHRDIALPSVVLTIAALIYLVSPVDLIPGVIPILGYIDVVFVLGVVAATLADEIRTFRDWERGRVGKEGRGVFVF